MAQNTIDEKVKPLTDTLERMKHTTGIRTTQSTRKDVHKFVFKLMILNPSVRFTMYAA